ncbi:MAG TPA: DUF1684 domain-containing protein [Anaerolineales bacterium]|nr:DUF1684 domain-containing protein [Anaerolineales bacterium]
MPDAAYLSEIENWRAALDADIKRTDGPLTIVGLFWIARGVSTIGSSPDCTFCLPRPAPRLIGAFEFDGQTLTFRADVGQEVRVDDLAAQPGARVTVRAGASPSRLTLGKLSMTPAQYGDRLGIQVRDSERPGLVNFAARRWFPVDPRFLLRGTYTPYPAPVKIAVPDSLGGTHYGYAQGYISVKVLGKSRNLDASEGEDGRLFIQFRDSTNGVQTYSEGRFLYSDVVSEDGEVLVDFNRAVNPLAAFTSFSPSAVAPRANTLDCAVEAGECLPPVFPD